MTEAYPLSWPEGWPRTPIEKRKDSRNMFGKTTTGPRGKTTRPWMFSEARDALVKELERIGGSGAVLSSNYQLRNDGLPTVNRGKPQDEGVAVYFSLNGRPMVMACDMHIGAAENMRSIALSLEAMRALERHGGGVMMERAFSGFQALPAPGPKKRFYWEVLGVPVGCPLDLMEVKYKELARVHHPDFGGSAEAMAELNDAIAQARKECAA